MAGDTVITSDSSTDNGPDVSAPTPPIPQFVLAPRTSPKPPPAPGPKSKRRKQNSTAVIVLALLIALAIAMRRGALRLARPLKLGPTGPKATRATTA